MPYTGPRLVNIPPLRFQERTDYINWEQVDAADIKALQNGDLGMIEHYSQQLVFSDLKKEDEEKLGNFNFINLFKICQLSVEYMLYLQDFLEKTAKTSEKEYSQLHERCIEIENSTRTQKTKMIELKKNIHVKKRSIKNYDFFLREYAKIRAPTLYICELCKGKSYSTEEELNAHYVRRHFHVETQKQIAEKTKKKNPNEDIERIVKEGLNTEMNKIQETLQ